MAAPIVQYVIVRSDLLKSLKWPIGAVLAQACHASSAALHLFYSHPQTQCYLADLDHMHKVILDGKDEDTLRQLSETLKENDVDHKLWIEQPENFVTCLATRPYPKNEIESHVKHLKLLK